MKKHEIWKPIKGFEGYYEVSSYGRVKSLARKVNRDFTNMNNNKTGLGLYEVSERILSPKKKRYAGVTLVKDGNPSYPNVHRLVAEAFIPNPQNKSEVNHIDGNKQNNNIDNLEWATSSENKLHSMHVLGTPSNLINWNKK